MQAALFASATKSMLDTVLPYLASCYARIFTGVREHQLVLLCLQFALVCHVNMPLSRWHEHKVSAEHCEVPRLSLHNLPCYPYLNALQGWMLQPDCFLKGAAAIRPVRKKDCMQVLQEDLSLRVMCSKGTTLFMTTARMQGHGSRNKVSLG